MTSDAELKPRDVRFMKKALRLAARGAGRVAPNPMVGAVIVREGRIVGEGFHLFEARDHAETVALKQAGSLSQGADLYVNLEPCSHQGRTPPCSDRIIQSGIARVFAAVRDPNPLVSGAGLRQLQQAGVEVHLGLLADAATTLNEKFFHFIRTGRPFTLLKLAMTLDGKIAVPGGESKWITGARSRRRVHLLRYEYDAVLVGVGTVLKDDPSLDVRGRRSNTIRKIVLDRRLRTPRSARLFASEDPVIIFHGREAPDKKKLALADRAHLLEVGTRGAFLDWMEIQAAMKELAIQSVVIEGGARVASTALKAGVVQKVSFFYGPLLVGGNLVAAVEDLGVRSLGEALRLNVTGVRRLGTDFLVEAEVEGFGADAEPREEN